MILLPLLVGCATPETESIPADAAPTWHQDVAPILARSCVGCHVSGGIGPFALDDYETARGMAAASAAAVASGSMPPFDAVEDDSCQPRYGWKDDLRLSSEEAATLQAWADAGAPEGDPATAAPLPVPPELELTGANQNLTPAETFTASGTEDEFMCASMDPGLTADRWLTGLQVVPGNPDVVHHVLVFSDPHGESAAWGDGWQECFSAPSLRDGQLVGAWAPGAVPFEAPDTSGIPVSAGTRLVMQIHYHPRGMDAAPDRTSLDLRWSDEAPAWDALLALIGNATNAGGGLLSGPDDRSADEPEFRIPAGATQHTETISIKLGRRSTGDFRIFAAGTHMHYVGTQMEIRWGRPDDGHGPTDECLVKTDWDFNWQRIYSYDAAIEDLPEGKGGDTLWMQCTYDNTLENPGVQRALSEQGLTEPIDVELGETTLDEMCLGVFGVLAPHEP